MRYYRKSDNNQEALIEEENSDSDGLLLLFLVWLQMLKKRILFLRILPRYGLELLLSSRILFLQRMKAPLLCKLGYHCHWLKSAVTFFIGSRIMRPFSSSFMINKSVLASPNFRRSFLGMTITFELSVW